MSNGAITYTLFLILLAAVALDVYLSANIVLQIVCILLAVGLLAVVAWIAFKLHLGTYVSNEQADNLQSYLSENIALNAQIKALGVDVQKAKKLALSSPELQNTIVQNRRLIAQISNLQTRVEQLSEQLQNAKNSKQTAVVPITPNEQKPNKNRTSKTA